MLCAVQVCGETQTCRIMSVEVSEDNVLIIDADPKDACVTYTISSEDAMPVVGPSGLTIDLTGKYLLECRVWKQGSPQSSCETFDINGKKPEFLTEPPASKTE